MPRAQMQLRDGKRVVWRLAEEEYVSLLHHSRPLLQNYELLLRLSQTPMPRGGSFTLAHALAVLERRFGPSALHLDEYRGTFSFPMLLTLEKERRISLLLNCHDYRSLIHFPLYRIASADPAYEGRLGHDNLNIEGFAQSELDDAIECFHALLRQEAESLDTAFVAPFFRSIESDMVVYGFDGHRFFERSYDHWEQYAAARRDLDIRLGPRRARSCSDRVERILARVTEP